MSNLRPHSSPWPPQDDEGSPAIKSYYFDKAYRDLWDTIKASWEENSKSSQKHFDQVSNFEPHPQFEDAFHIAAGCSIFVFGTAAFVVASTIHVVVLLSLCLIVYICSSMLYGLERVVMVLRRFFAACPYCHEKASLPFYRCDQCRRIHSRLIPGQYGIFHHTCRCGNQLPATFFLDRGGLQALCINTVCRVDLSRKLVESRKLNFPIFGGASSGKTVLLHTILERIIQRSDWSSKVGVKFVRPDESRTHSTVVKDLKQGMEPPKTSELLPTACTVALDAGGWERVLYLYDPAGEALADQEHLSTHRYTSYVHGLILVIDPFSIDRVRQHYESQPDWREFSIRPSELPLEDLITRVTNHVEQAQEISTTDRIKVPLAVVITKVDAFDLEEKLGPPAVQRAQFANPELSDEEAGNQVIRSWLRAHGEEHTVHMLEKRFTVLQFFSVSGLGRMPDNSASAPYVSKRVLDPIDWLFEKADGKSFRERS